MGRHREPAAILKLRGSFDKDPRREREDAQGAGEFGYEPPAHLTGEEINAWRHLVVRLPKIALTSSDEPLVELAARTYAALRGTLGCQTTFRPLAQQLLAILIELGMTPGARTKLVTPPTAKVNKFQALKDSLPGGE